MPLDRSRTLARAVWAGVVAIAGIGVYYWATSFLQYRASYPGGLVFVGHRVDGATQYVRLFMWKPADYRDTLPAMAIHFEDKSYALSEFSPETAASLGGTLDIGALWDSEGWLFQYRFENGRLTYISMMRGIAGERSAHRPKPGGNVRSTPFAISLNNGPKFMLPVSQRELIEKAGNPDRITKQIPN